MSFEENEDQDYSNGSRIFKTGQFYKFMYY